MVKVKFDADGSPANSAGKQSIEELQSRYSKLNAKKIEAETELKGAKRRLDELKVEALQKYGTDDVAELRQKLADMKAENEQKRAKYQADLDLIEQSLAEVEQSFSEADSAVTDGASSPA
jgi:chromosome segregation ATPase